MRDLQAARGAPLRNRFLPLFGALALTVLALDVASKVMVVARLRDAEPVSLLGGLVYLVHTRNTGAAFSIAPGMTVALSVIAAVVCVVIIRISRRLASVGWACALGLILGGAAGNLVDRLFRAPGVLRGGVVDFVSLLDPHDPPWPVFNLADSALVVGVCLAVVLELRGHRLGGARSRGSGSDDAR